MTNQPNRAATAALLFLAAFLPACTGSTPTNAAPPAPPPAPPPVTSPVIPVPFPDLTNPSQQWGLWDFSAPTIGAAPAWIEEIHALGVAVSPGFNNIWLLEINGRDRIVELERIVGSEIVSEVNGQGAFFGSRWDCTYAWEFKNGLWLTGALSYSSVRGVVHCTLSVTDMHTIGKVFEGDDFAVPVVPR